MFFSDKFSILASHFDSKFVKKHIVGKFVTNPHERLKNRIMYYLLWIKFREVKFCEPKKPGFNFASQSFEKSREYLIWQMSQRAAEIDLFFAKNGEF